MAIALITGSAGLIGSEATRFFSERGLDVVGIDNDMRSYFFGISGSTRRSRQNSNGRFAGIATSTPISEIKRRWKRYLPPCPAELK